MLALDDPDELKKGLPLELMNREGMAALMGAGLRECLASDRFREVVVDALQFIDNFEIAPTRK